MKNALKSTAVALGLLSMTVGAAFALPPLEQQVPYHSYTYGIWDTSVPAHPAYEPMASVTGTDLDIGAMASPRDLCRDGDGNISILDSGNFRIIKIDSNLKMLEVLDAEQNNDSTIQ